MSITRTLCELIIAYGESTLVPRGYANASGSIPSVCIFYSKSRTLYSARTLAASSLSVRCSGQIGDCTDKVVKAWLLEGFAHALCCYFDCFAGGIFGCP
jgi:hypothetical protein